MTRKSSLRPLTLITGLSLLFAFCIINLNSCGGAQKSEETKAVDDEAFYQTQPLQSGLYNADYYDIEGTNARKGRFDGRIYFSLSPELSAFYVFENGNRTKIDFIVPLEKPFEKNDSGIYFSTDSKDRPVTISTDSTMYTLNFQRSGEDIKIIFDPKPRHTGTAVEILEKINAQKNKK